MASVAILLSGFGQAPVEEIRFICNATFAIAIVGTVGMGITLGPDLSTGRAGRLLDRIPRIGRPLKNLIYAVRMYNRKPMVLFLTSLMTAGVHVLFAIGCYFIACGLPGNHLSLADHLVVMPLSSAMGVIPLSVGPMEAAVDFFYKYVPVSGPPIPDGQGFVVALVYRLITLLIAALGSFYYFRNRREMADVIHEAEQEEPA